MKDCCNRMELAINTAKEFENIVKSKCCFHPLCMGSLMIKLKITKDDILATCVEMVKPDMLYKCQKVVVK